jgi:hypothetical protein
MMTSSSNPGFATVPWEVGWLTVIEPGLSGHLDETPAIVAATAADDGLFPQADERENTRP